MPPSPRPLDRARVRHSEVLSTYAPNGADGLLLAVLASVAAAIAESGADSLEQYRDRLEAACLPRWADDLERRKQQADGCQGRYRDGRPCHASAHPYCARHRPYA